MWDWERRREVHRFNSRHISNVFQSKFLPLSAGTSPHVVSTSRDGQVRLAIVRGEGGDVITKQLAKHKGSSNKLALLGAQVRQFLVIKKRMPKSISSHLPNSIQWCDAESGH